ncbi:MAG: hypothetical protein GY899_14390 [Verrucomicrobiaceae bacterium]|nr:hypothetical protein [Verrucomicrobiaceae bacterium]
MAPAEPEQSIIRSSAPRSNDTFHDPEPLKTPDIEPVTNGIPLPSRPPSTELRQSSLPENPPASRGSTKNRISLHPIAFILIVLLAAGSGVTVMLMINPINHSTLALPTATTLKSPVQTGTSPNTDTSLQAIPQPANYPPAKPPAPPRPSPPAPTPVPTPEKTAETTAPAKVPPLPSVAVSSTQSQVAPPAIGVNAARGVLDAFLAADSVEERIKHVQTPDFVAPKMEIYYSKYPLKLEVTDIKHEVSSPVPQSNRQFHIFQLTTPQHPSGFPASVEETQHGCLVDWTSFIQFHDNLLGKFIRIYQPQPDTFHAILERAHYFRSDVPELGSKFCFRIKPPIPGYEGHAFINHGSPLADLIEQKFKWDKIYFPVIELQWTRTPDGARYIEIKDILQDNWRAIQ